MTDQPPSPAAPTPGPWSWINSNHADKRLGRLFGNSDLVLDCPDFIYGKPEDARLIANAPETAAERDRLVVVNEGLVKALEFYAGPEGGAWGKKARAALDEAHKR